MKPMELIERYVNEVGRHLPGKTRDDIQLELLSLLQDALDERAADGQEPDTAATVELLKEFGSPEEIAAQYRPSNALIGPALLPIYKLVVTVVLAVLGGLYALLLLLNLLGGDPLPELGRTIWELVTSYLQTAFFNVGLITAIFYLIERTVDLPESTSEKEAWNPLDLPAVDNPNRINRFELIAGIVGGLVVISILTGAGKWQIEGISGFFGLLAPEFLAQIPWLIASFGFDIIVKVVVTWQGRWQTWTRWADIAQEGFGLYVLYRVFQGPILTLGTLPNGGIKVVLGIIMTIVVFEIIGKLYRLLIGRPIVDFESLKGRFA